MIEDKKLEDGKRKILILIKKLYDNLSVKSEENYLNYEDLFFLYDEDWINNKKKYLYKISFISFLFNKISKYSKRI
jgi:hypothetical protein